MSVSRKSSVVMVARHWTGWYFTPMWVWGNINHRAVLPLNFEKKQKKNKTLPYPPSTLCVSDNLVAELHIWTSVMNTYQHQTIWALTSSALMNAYLVPNPTTHLFPGNCGWKWTFLGVLSVNCRQCALTLLILWKYLLVAKYPPQQKKLVYCVTHWHPLAKLCEPPWNVLWALNQPPVPDPYSQSI